jgi:GNAT superfamily N-acetyltransferase
MRVVECGAGNLGDARALVFEYMAATVAETSGRAAPSRIDELPRVLRAECEDLAAVYSHPGTLLLAYAGGAPAGCAGLADRGERTAEVKRLYVRPAYRRAGIARALMARVHARAAELGFHDPPPRRDAVTDPGHRVLPASRVHAGRALSHDVARARWCSCGDLSASKTFGYPEHMRYLVSAGWWRPA